MSKALKSTPHAKAAAHTAPQLSAAELDLPDAKLIGEIHCAAFPKSGLAVFGRATACRYYQWQLSNSDEMVAIGVWSGERLLGFSLVGGALRPLRDFVRGNFTFLGWQVITGPLRLLKVLLSTPLPKSAGLLRHGLRFASPANLKGPSSPEDFWIHSLAVHPDHHGKGIGNLLLSESEAVARRRGCREIRLAVHLENKKAISLYVKAGWERAGDTAHWRGGMKKSLCLFLAFLCQCGWL